MAYMKTQSLHEEVILFISVTEKKKKTSIQAQSSSSRSLRIQNHFNDHKHKSCKYVFQAVSPCCIYSWCGCATSGQLQNKMKLFVLFSKLSNF